MNPQELKFAKSHEWVSVNGDIATIGISEFAVKQLTDLVYIELPETNRTLAAEESFGEVESVKAVSDLYTPIAGEVVEVNESLANNLAALSDDPYGAGWVMKLKIANPAELDSLLSFSDYEKHCQAEES